jgi:deoxyribodipyrimidine photo-lyase
VVVFTRDLRVTDIPALCAAVATSASVVPLFVLDDALVNGTHNATRLRFLLEALADLDASLRQRGGALVVRRGPWLATVIETARACGAQVIHIADDVSGYAHARLARLKAAAQTSRLTVLTHPGVTVVPAGAIRPGSGTAYQVFTPYYRRWLDQPRRPAAAAPRRIALPPGIVRPAVPELGELTGAAPARPGLAGGESAGLRRLRGWIADDLAD